MNTNLKNVPVKVERLSTYNRDSRQQGAVAYRAALISGWHYMKVEAAIRAVPKTPIESKLLGVASTARRSCRRRR